MSEFVSQSEIENKLEYILSSPSVEGEVKMIVRRPTIEGREVLTEGELTFEDGLKGDTWKLRNSSKTKNDGPLLDAQLTIINSRLIDAISKSMDDWPLAGDQLYVDFDLSRENIPAGTLLKIGKSIVEVSATPHTGCGKFKERFGSEALKFINSERGRFLNLRGINAKIIQEGIIATGDRVLKI